MFTSDVIAPHLTRYISQNLWICLVAFAEKFCSVRTAREAAGCITTHD